MATLVTISLLLSSAGCGSEVEHGDGPASRETDPAGACEPSAGCGECIQCAALGPCNDVVIACGNEPDCLAFADCVTASKCQDLECPECREAHATGAPLFDADIACTFCDACPTACREVATFCDRP